MYVSLHCLLLAVISSTVFCRPEGGLHHPTPTTDDQSRTFPIHPLELTTNSKDSIQSLVTSDDTTSTLHNTESEFESEIPKTSDSSSSSSESKEASNEYANLPKLSNPPKESDEDVKAFPINYPFGSDQGISSTMTLDNSHQESTGEVESDESSLVLDTVKDSEETPKDSSEDSPLPLDSKKDFESDDSFRKALIEDLKSRILQKLHLPSPPSYVSPFNLSPEVLLLMHKEEDDSEAKEEENLIVHPSNSNFTSCTTSSCRKMEFNITSDLESVVSVQAWINKRSSSRLTLSVYSASEVIATIKEDPRKMASEASGWAMFELPTMSLIEVKEGLQCIIETEGDINTEGASSPFLVVRKYINTPKKTKRNARSTNENCSCCTENHYITIKDLGWQNWVISPAGFNVKTCAGQCEENRSSFTINYQRIISTLYKINKTIPKPKCNFWAPSCKPDSYLPQRIMYLYDNGTVHDHLLPDMLIGSCRCM